MSEYVGKINELPEALGNFMPNSSKKVVFGPTHFWTDYVLRCFDLEPLAGSHEPHTHEWCHWMVVFEGNGVVNIDGEEHPVERGSWCHIPGNIPHNFYNSSDSEHFVFLCIVPPEGDVNPMLAGSKGC